MLFSLPCCEDHGSPSHGDKCPHVWNLTKKAEVPNKMTSWHNYKFVILCHFSVVEFTAWSCILELQSGFAQRPYWRARVSTGHPNRSWTLHSLSHASPACKASPQFQFRRTVTNVFQVTHLTNWANQCSEKLVPYTSLAYSTLFKPKVQRSTHLGCCCKGQHWNGCMCSYPNGVVHNLEVVSVRAGICCPSVLHTKMQSSSNFTT